MSIQGDRARALLANALGISPGAINDGAGIKDFEQWDSLGHMRLVAAIEAECGLILSAEQILALASLEDVINLLSRTGQAGIQ